MQSVSPLLYVILFFSNLTIHDRYTSALQALSHALLLAPQNPFTALQFAETAYTAGDLPLSLKMFLVVVDMGERDLPKDEPPIAFNIRAWLGVKLVCIQPPWVVLSRLIFVVLTVFTTTCFVSRFTLCVSDACAKSNQSHR
jgi:hypothetical protein